MPKMVYTKAQTEREREREKSSMDAEKKKNKKSPGSKIWYGQIGKLSLNTEQEATRR